MARHETEMHRAKRILEDENVRIKLALQSIARAYPNLRIGHGTIAELARDAITGPQSPCNIGLFGERQTDIADKL